MHSRDLRIYLALLFLVRVWVVATQSEPVLPINGSVFEMTLHRNNYSIVLFHMKEHKESQMYQNAFRALAEKHPDVRFFELDCSSDPDFCIGQRIKHVPLLRVFHKSYSSGGLALKEGTVEEMQQRISQSLSLRPMTLTSREEYRGLIEANEEDYLVIGFFKNQSINLYHAYLSLVHRNEERARFYLASSSQDFLSETNRTATIRRYLPNKFESEHEPKEAVYRGRSEGLAAWFDANLFGKFPILRLSDLVKFQRLPISVIIIVKEEEMVKERREELFPAILEYTHINSSIQFAMATMKEFESELPFFNYEEVEEVTNDLIIITERAEKRVKKYSYNAPINKETIGELISNLTAHRLTPLPRSQIMKEFNLTGLHLKIITAFKSEAIFSDLSHDKLVMFHSSTDLYSKSLMSTTLRLAQIFKDEEYVAVYAYDVAENDYESERFRVLSLPTFYWLTMEGREEAYTGSLDGVDLYAFVCKRSSRNLSGFRRDGSKRLEPYVEQVVDEERYIKRVEL